MGPNYGYNHTKGFLVFIMMIIIMCVTSAYAQTSPNTPSGYSIDSQTGNLIPDGSLTSATGWSVTTGSPTWTPVSPSGSFSPDGYTFSYVKEELGVAGVNLGSFNHGYLNSSAVFVTGFSYGLTYRFPCANNIGTNCDGTSQTAAPANPIQDNLRVEVGYYPATGSATFYVHQLGLKNINDGNSPYNPNWQTLAETVTFAGAKTLAQAGAVNMGIIGNDAGNWACVGTECYGPQVKNAYIRANYSVDPCILNPAFNPSCPGFNNVIQGWASPTYWNSYNIAATLPHIGGGVQLHGFDYGFSWSNYGSCYNTFLFWCTDWRTDGGGFVNFRVSDKNNTTLYYDRQYREGNNWSGSYSNRFLFTETRNSLDMGSVQWWTDSVWNNFWVAGWTRPIWTPDPCYFNGLYSPNCTNFQATLTQVLADIKAQQDKISAQNTSVTSSTNTPGGTITTTVVADSTNPTVTVTTDPSATAVESSQSRTLLGNGITVDNTQSLAMSLIKANERQQRSITMSASQQAVNQAAQTAQSSQRDAEQLALTQSVGSSSQAANDAQDNTANERTNTQVIAVNLPNQNTSSGLQSQLQISSTARIQPSPQFEQQSNQTNQQESAIAQSYTPVIIAAPMPLPPLQSTESTGSYTPPPVPSIQTETNQQPQQYVQQQMSIPAIASQTAAAAESNPIQVAAINNRPDMTGMQEQITTTTNFITDRTNPLTSIVEGRTTNNIDSNQQEQRGSVVNKNTANNDLAGGVSIESIAVAPQGFNVYASLVLRDAAFYAPKEIYRGQKNVDNARALRQLGSDRLHQEMVDQQYRR